MIYAGSPQAKGRVERSHGTDQDRLIKGFELEEIQDLRTANRFLQQRYWKQINQKFAVDPADPQDQHQPLQRPSLWRRSFAGNRPGSCNETGLSAMKTAAFKCWRTIRFDPRCELKSWSGDGSMAAWRFSIAVTSSVSAKLPNPAARPQGSKPACQPALSNRGPSTLGVDSACRAAPP